MFFVGNSLKAPSDDSTGMATVALAGIGTVVGATLGALGLEQPTDSKMRKTSVCFMASYDARCYQAKQGVGTVAGTC